METEQIGRRPPHSPSWQAQKSSAPEGALLSEFLEAKRENYLPPEVAQAADIFFSCAARRETFREPVFLCTTPLVTARISSD